MVRIKWLVGCVMMFAGVVWLSSGWWFLGGVGVVVGGWLCFGSRWLPTLPRMSSVLDVARPAVREYRAALQAALADGELSDCERAELTALADRLGIDDKTRRRLYASALAVVFSSMAQDRRIDDAERAALIKLQAQLDVDLPAETIQDYRRFRLLAEIDNGVLPVLELDGVMLQAGEEVHWSEPGDLVEEKVVSRRYQGGSQGVSIPLGGGVRWRVGAARGKMVSEYGLVKVSAGRFVVTNKRLMFAGDKKSFSVPFGKLVNINLAADGVVLGMATGKPRMVCFSVVGNADVVGSVISAVVGRKD